MTFNKDAYRERLGITAAVSLDFSGLMTLHLAQAFAIPFENLDIMLGRRISVSPDAICKKLLESQRGGYCFELNGLFMQALEAFGFMVRPLLARVHISGQPSGRTHKICLVSIEGKSWLADVGFGMNGIREPIQIVPDVVSEQCGRSFRLVEDDKYGLMLQCQTPKGWKPLYSFDLSHVCSADIEMGNYYSSTHEKSVFTSMPIVTRPTRAGRVTLRQDNLKVDDGTTVVDTTITKPGEYSAALAAHFDLEFSQGEVEALFARCRG